jgi:glycosyltransferase involved in cell wall biosynthesis
LGWIGGSCHVEDMELLYPLGCWSVKEKPAIEFYIVNDGVKDSVYEYYRKLVTDDGLRDNYFPIPTTDVYEYGMNYSLFDVALAPLKDTEFNIKKSELKVIEAGFHKKALIVSRVKPYTDICNTKNSLLCNTPKDWISAVKKLLKEPNLVTDLAEQLYLDVQPFHVAEVNKKRFQVYKSLCTK